MQDVLRLSGATGIDIVSGLMDQPDTLDRVDATADLILISRDALKAGLGRRFSRQERIRPWTYEFDPSGLELLRRAIDKVATDRPREVVAS